MTIVLSLSVCVKRSLSQFGVPVKSRGLQCRERRVERFENGQLVRPVRSDQTECSVYTDWRVDLVVLVVLRYVHPIQRVLVSPPHKRAGEVDDFVGGLDRVHVLSLSVCAKRSLPQSAVPVKCRGLQLPLWPVGDQAC